MGFVVIWIVFGGNDRGGEFSSDGIELALRYHGARYVFLQLGVIFDKMMQTCA